MRAGSGGLLLNRFPIASQPRPGLAAELPAVALGLHEFGTVAESGPYLGDRGDAVVGEKAAEILALRHHLLVLQRQLGPDRVRFTPSRGEGLPSSPADADRQAAGRVGVGQDLH